MGLATWAFLFMLVDVIGCGKTTHTQEDHRASDKSLVHYLLKSTVQTNCRDCHLQVKLVAVICGEVLPPFFKCRCKSFPYLISPGVIKVQPNVRCISFHYLLSGVFLLNFFNWRIKLSMSCACRKAIAFPEGSSDPGGMSAFFLTDSVSCIVTDDRIRTSIPVHRQ